jgi:hypothetical protein
LTNHLATIDALDAARPSLRELRDQWRSLGSQQEALQRELERIDDQRSALYGAGFEIIDDLYSNGFDVWELDDLHPDDWE